MDTPTRTSIYGSQVTCHNLLSEETCLVNSRLLHTLPMRKSSKSSTRKDPFTHLRSPAKRTFKCLIQDTPLWHGVMSMNLKNPKSQDDCKKGTLSNQPQLTHITPTALLGSWGRQPIKDMMSLRTDFEMHAYWQGCTEIHLRPLNVVTHCFGDGDLDVDHCKVWKLPLQRNWERPALSHQAKGEEPTETGLGVKST